MAFDRADYDALIKDKLREQAGRSLSRLELMRQGAVAGELLTGNAAWDAFLRYVQGAIDQTERQLATFQLAFTSPDLLDQSQLLRVKVDALRCSERISAWKAVMQLPKDLIEQGEQAQSLLERMEKIGGDDRGNSGEA